MLGDQELARQIEVGRVSSQRQVKELASGMNDGTIFPTSSRFIRKASREGKIRTVPLLEEKPV